MKLYKRISSSQEQFLVAHLKNEWEDIERAAKKHEMAARAAEAGMRVGRVLLGTLLVSGMVALAVVAPNVCAVFSPRRKSRRYIKSENMPRTLAQGSSRGYWKYEKTGEGEYRVRLTPKGKQVALRAALHGFKLHERKKWDGRYRVVMYDVARKHNSARDGFRHRLTAMGMYPLQNSVFVYPHPCAEEVMFFLSLFNVTQKVHIIEGAFTTKIDSELRRVFEL